MTVERETFLRLGDVVARIAEVIREKRRGLAPTGVGAVEHDAESTVEGLSTVEAVAVLAEVGVIDPGTATRMLRRVLEEVAPTLSGSKARIGPPDGSR